MIFEFDTFAIGITESKVDQPDGAIVVDEEILGLEISVDDVELVNVLDAGDDLLKYGACFILGDSVLFHCLLLGFDNIVKKLSGIHVLHDQE